MSYIDHKCIDQLYVYGPDIQRPVIHSQDIHISDIQRSYIQISDNIDQRYIDQI